MTDWLLIKTQFEVLGKSVEELCKAHHVKPDILNSVVESEGWVANPIVIDSEVDERLGDVGRSIQVAHQATIMPTYIALENQFFTKLKDLINTISGSKEAKLMAETLLMLRPTAMKHADAKATADGSVGEKGLQILIQNQFPVPQPGDDNYIPHNAVIIGDAARTGTDLTLPDGTQLMRVDVDIEHARGEGVSEYVN